MKFRVLYDFPSQESRNLISRRLVGFVALRRVVCMYFVFDEYVIVVLEFCVYLFLFSQLDDIDALSVIHVSGTKGKASLHTVLVIANLT